MPTKSIFSSFQKTVKALHSSYSECLRRRLPQERSAAY
jgi:hypothetical protein